ncbi:MAG: alkaline phosphatase [Spirochaetes bacterium]|nr:alkaline phosphatase [Spirochaetota bacterium]
MKTKIRNLFLKLFVTALPFCLLFFLFVNNSATAGTASRNSYAGNKAKYVFLFIGDGMGLPQVSAAEIYSGAGKNSKYPDGSRVLSFTDFPSQGLTTTHDASSFITDSASAGTAIACGYKTLNGVISMDVDKKIKYESISKKAKKNGMKVGIISSVSIDHATPATFYSNQPSRKNMYEISLELADSGFDYFAGGSVDDPDGKKSKMQNKPGNVFSYAKKKGYKIINSKKDFVKLNKKSGKVWVVTEQPADAASMLYEIDRKNGVSSLADFTKKGIEVLDNENGFFMMVEGGKIDWACHANDGMSAIRDTFAFSEAVQHAVDFAKKHPAETLIVVTGDHECGGMTIGFAGTQYDTFFNKLNSQKVSFAKFDEDFSKMKAKSNLTFDSVMPLITKYFGLKTGKGGDMDLTGYEMDLLKTAFAESLKDAKSRTNDENSAIIYGSYEPLTVTITHILNRKAGIGWTTYSHTGVPVPTYAYGTGNEIFNGFYDNTDIYGKMAAVMNIK